MPKEINGIIKYRKSELYLLYKEYLSVDEVIAIKKTTKTFIDLQLNMLIKKKSDEFTFEELETYYFERLAKIEELEAAIAALVGVSGQDAALAAARKELSDYIDEEEFKYVCIIEPHTAFNLERKFDAETGKDITPIENYKILRNAVFNNCILGPDSIFLGVELNDATFNNCNISGSTIFSNVDIRNTTITNCALNNINFNFIADPIGLPKDTEEFIDPRNHGHSHGSLVLNSWTTDEIISIDNNDFSYFAPLSIINFENSIFNNCLFGNKYINLWNLNNTVFNTCTIENFILEECIFANIKFNDTILNNIKIVNYGESDYIKFNNCDIQNSHFINIKVKNCNFSDQIFKSNKIYQCLLENCVFTNISFKNQAIASSKLVDCLLNNVDLRYCNLKNSEFINCNLSNFRSEFMVCPKIKNTKLENVILPENKNFSFEVLFNCTLKNLTFNNYNFTFTNFDSAKIDNCIFNNCTLHGSNASDSVISNTTFNSCLARGLLWNNANMINVNFNNSNLNGANFKNSNMVNTKFNNTTTRGVTF